MTAPPSMFNAGAACLTAAASINNDAVAGGGGDNAEVAGAIIDLNAIGNPKSAKLIITYVTTLTAVKTLTFAVDVDHGDASNLSDAAVLDAGFTATVVETGALTAHLGTVELDVNLSGAKRYLRANATPNLSHTDTDTVNWTMTWAFFGFQTLPATATL